METEEVEKRDAVVKFIRNGNFEKVGSTSYNRSKTPSQGGKYVH